MMRRISRKILLTVFVTLAACSRSPPQSGTDLSQAQGGQIRMAMASGAMSLLPDCIRAACTPGKTQLVQAASLRIGGKLELSMEAARRCFSMSKDQPVTHYTCARLVNMDAKDIGGLYGEKSTIDELADATKALYLHHVFGVTADFSSSYMARRTAKLDELDLRPERVVFDNAIGSTRLLGYERSDRFINEHPDAAPAIAYLYPSAEVVVNGMTFTFRIDTGAQASSLNAAAARKAKLVSIAALQNSITSITGTDSSMGVGIAHTLKFANVEIFNKSVSIVPDGATDTRDPADGILGWDVLRKIPAFAFAGDRFEVNPDVPVKCAGKVSLSSDINTGGVVGVVVNGSTFNGKDAVVLFDSGNAIAGILPTLQLVDRQQLKVTDPHDLTISASGGYSRIHSGKVEGTLRFLGVDYSGAMTLGTNLPDMPIDFDIGLPLFSGKNVYLNLDEMKICSWRTR